MRTLVLIAALGAVICSGCSRSAAALLPVGAGINYFPPSQRHSAPTLTGTSVEGAPISAAGQSGRLRVVNLWGSWCPPCRAEANGLAAASKALRSSGVSFVGIDLEDTRAKAAAFEHTHGITYPSLFDPNGAWRAKFAYPAFATPTTYVIDTRANIAAVVYGKVTELALERLVDRVRTSA